jgi:hypothetical protein
MLACPLCIPHGVISWLSVCTFAAIRLAAGSSKACASLTVKIGGELLEILKRAGYRRWTRAQV